MPSAPAKIAGRAEAERPSARREYESFDSYESFSMTLAAGTAFQVFPAFSGTVERVRISNTGSVLTWRFRRIGQAATTEFSPLDSTGADIVTLADFVEVRDTSGAGGQFASIIGYHPSRHIDRRSSWRGPGASDVRPREQGAPEQIAPR